MKTWLVTGFLALALPAAAFAQHAPATSQPRTVTVTGTSSQQFAPDRVVVSVSLVSKDSDLKTAKSRNDAMVEKLLAITRKLDIPKDQVSTSNVYISPEYSYDNKEGKQRFTGYTVNRSLRVTLNRLDVHERLLSAIVDAKIDQVNGVNFELADPEKYAGALRVKAFEDARAKAVALAVAAGDKLGPALSISATDGRQPIGGPPRPMPMMAAMRAESPASVAPSLPGMIELRESVDATFALE